MSIATIYQTLAAHYGDLRWWPAETPYEVIVGAVLTQNTAWRNVEKAIANFGGRDFLSPQFVRDVDPIRLAAIIHPAGFYNQKALYLKAVTAWFEQYGYDAEVVRQQPLDSLRRELLAVKGVGKETADSILLYAFGFATFVVDAYTMRLCGRHGIDAGKTYDAVKAFFEANLPQSAEVYNHYHAYIVMLGKDFCRKTRPLCAACPLAELCARHLTPIQS